ncbi:hypothetical protein [Leminorella grimontii]|uniref:hypothetical protein n=1 Tax=Leminorella grimontii TaxID=82981 RepID=UPI00321F6BDC
MKSPLIEAIEELGPSDVATLAGYLDRSEGMINASLTHALKRGVIVRDGDKYRLSDDMSTSAPVSTPILNEEKKREVAPVTQVSAPIKTDTAPAKKTIVEPPAPGQTDRCRIALAEASHELNSAELAERAGVSRKNIYGLLSTDVKAGKLSMRKIDGVNYYGMTTTQKPLSTTPALVDEIASTELPKSSDLSTSTPASAEPAPVKEIDTKSTVIQAAINLPPAGDEMQTITLPTVAYVERQLKQLHAEFKRLKDLKDVLVRLEKVKGCIENQEEANHGQR